MEVFDTVAEFIEWIDATLTKLNGPDAVGYSTIVWGSAWEQAVASAYHLGLPDKVDGLGGPFPSVMFVSDSPAGKAIRDQLRDRLIKLKANLVGVQISQSNRSGTGSRRTKWSQLKTHLRESGKLPSTTAEREAAARAYNARYGGKAIPGEAGKKYPVANAEAVRSACTQI